jgi:hypothetical protein
MVIILSEPLSELSRESKLALFVCMLYIRRVNFFSQQKVVNSDKSNVRLEKISKVIYKLALS